MSLKDVIVEAMKTAMRAQDKQRLMTIRTILAEIKQIEVDERIEVDDTRALAVLDKMIKRRRESIKIFEEAGRLDLLEIEQQEVAVIETFMPEPLSDSDVDAMIQEALKASGAVGVRDMGKVMALVRPQVQGRADMGLVSAKIKAHLESV